MGHVGAEPTSGGDDIAVTITPAAADETVSLLREESMGTDVTGLRLLVQWGGYAGLSHGMRFDNELESNDTVVGQHDLRVFVDPTSMNCVGGSALGFEGGLQDAGFHINSPNAEGSCGCGESFRTQGPIS